MKVFLGGTSNGSTWREELIPLLEMAYAMPSVDDLDEVSHQQILKDREDCDHYIFVITPKMRDFFALAEVIDVAIKKPGLTIFCFLREDEGEEFSEAEIVSMENVGWRVSRNKAVWCRTIDEIAYFLNYKQYLGDTSLTNNEIKEEAVHFYTYRFLQVSAQMWAEMGKKDTQLLRGQTLEKTLPKWEKLTAAAGKSPNLPPIKPEMVEFVMKSRQKWVSKADHKISLFISYSRNPSTPLAKGLYEHLKDKYEVWYDKVSILPGEDFKASIERGIRHCDNFIYIISTRAVKSVYCQAELEMAKEYGKRIIPLQHERDVDESLIDPDISDINRVFPAKEGCTEWDYDHMEQRIAEVASVEPGIVAGHTRYHARAVNWKMNGSNSRLLMYGTDLEEYEKWQHDLLSAKLETNPLTDFQLAYFSDSYAFDALGFREVWIAGLDEDLHRFFRSDFTLNFNPLKNEPDDLPKAEVFLFLVNEQTVNDKILLSQLALARAYKLSISFIQQEEVAEEALAKLKISPDETHIKALEGLSSEALHHFKKELSIRLGTEYEYYQSPSFLKVSAREWAQRNKPNNYLLRGRSLAFFDNAYKSNPSLFTEQTGLFIQASRSQADHAPYEVFISRKSSKRNFANWLSGILLDQNISSWNQQDYLKEDSEELSMSQEGIAESLNVVFILSAEFEEFEQDPLLMSQLAQAKKLNKRIFVVRNDNTEVPDALAEYPLISFVSNQEQASFELIDALTTDQEFLRFLNDLYPTVLLWAQSSKSEQKDLLLTGFPLDNAANTVANHQEKTPDQVKAFIKACQREVYLKERRKKINSAIIIILATASFVSLIFSLFQLQEVKKAQLKAEKEKMVADSLRIKAQQDQKIAEEARRQAEKERQEAQKQKREADKQRIIAENQTEQANIAKNEALKAQRDLEKTNQDLFEKKEEIATNEKIARSDSRFYKSQILANQVRSTSRVNDNTLSKALEAYYLFVNEKEKQKYKGENTDIYSALFRVASDPSFEIPTFDTVDQHTKEPIFSFTMKKQANAFASFSANDQQTLVRLRQPSDSEPTIKYFNGYITDGAFSPDGQHLWFCRNDGVYVYDITGQTPIQISRSSGSGFVRIVTSPMSESHYLVATRSSAGILAVAVPYGQVSADLKPLVVPSNYPYLEAFALDGEAKTGRVHLFFAKRKADNQVVISSQQLELQGDNLRIAPYLPDMAVGFDPSFQANDLVTCLEVGNGQLVGGTQYGSVFTGKVRSGASFSAVRKAESSIKKVVLNQTLYGALVYGNQSENSQIILNTFANERNLDNAPNPVSYLKIGDKDIFNDIFIEDDRLYFLLNNQVVVSHQLNADLLAAQICQAIRTQRTCQPMRNSFLKNFNETEKADETPVFCNCNEEE